MTTYAAVPTSEAPAGSTLRLLNVLTLATVAVAPNPDGTGTPQTTFAQGSTVYAAEGSYLLQFSVGVAGGRRLPIAVKAPTPPVDVPAPDWTPGTYYRAGQLVVQGGALQRRKTSGTSGTSFDQTQWDALGSGTYAPLVTNTWLVVGDSIADFNRKDGPTDVPPILSNPSHGYATVANIILNHRLNLVFAGVGGETQAQINLRLDALLAANPGAGVIDEGGVNSISAGVDAATLWAQKQEAYNKYRAAGRRFVVTTICPKGDHTTAQRLVQNTVNRKIREYARANGVPLADFAAGVTDPVTGSWITGYSNAGDPSPLHPNTKGAIRMGTLLAAALDRITAPVDLLPVSNVDTANLLTNGCQVGTGGTLGTGVTGSGPTGWSTNFTTGSGTAVVSKVARTDGKPGEWTQIALTSGTGTLRHTQAFTSGLIIGGRYKGRLEFQVDPGALFSRFALYVYAQDAGNVHLLDVYDNAYDEIAWDATTQIGSGVFEIPDLVLPSTSTRLQYEPRICGIGTARFGRAELTVS